MPLVILAIWAALEYFDDNLLYVARSLGAKELYAWRTVMLPFIFPAVLIGGILSFINSLDEAVVAIFLGRGTAVTIPNLMWRQLNVELSPDIAAVAVKVALFGLFLQTGGCLFLVRYIGRLRRQWSWPEQPNLGSFDPEVGGATMLRPVWSVLLVAGIDVSFACPLCCRACDES